MSITTCYYFGGNNFGDSVNSVFIDFLADKQYIYKKKPDQLHYMVTGSVLHFSNANSIIFGSGFISDTSNLGSGKPNKIIAVRGPLTREKIIKMNIECPEIYGDPLILFPLLYKPSIKSKQKTVGIIPHFIDLNSVLNYRIDFAKLISNLMLYFHFELYLFLHQAFICLTDYAKTSTAFMAEDFCSKFSFKFDFIIH